MSFDQKKSINIEYDELNIKSHLNTSLDLEGISVSEDLINRTLEAIRKQSQVTEMPVTEQQTQEPERKVIPWFRYARNIAVVAAAGLILVVGMKGLGQVSKKDNNFLTKEMKAENFTYDMAAKEDAAPEAAGSAADTGSSTTEYAAKSAQRAPAVDSDDDNTMFSVAQDQPAAADPGIEIEKSAAVGMLTVDDALTNGDVEGDSLLLSFKEINPILPEEVQELSISGTAGQDEKLISDTEEIGRFYQLMEAYAYVPGDITDRKIRYTVTMYNDGRAVILQISEGWLTAAYTDGGILIEHSYQITGENQLVIDLETWYQTKE